MQVLKSSRSSRSQVANVKPTVGVLNSLIDACSQAQMLGAGIEVFNFIKQESTRVGHFL